MIKFGSSTRVFLLHGPEEDQEEESKYTYTQLREMRKEELDRKENAYLEEQAKLSAKAEEEEARGIDWGMGKYFFFNAIQYMALNSRINLIFV